MSTCSLLISPRPRRLSSFPLQCHLLSPSSSPPPSMPPEPNHAPPTHHLRIPPCWCQTLKRTTVHVCACVFMCTKGSGLVAGTIGPPTAFCSDALSPEPSSKLHGKTIKPSFKSLLRSFSSFLSLSFYLASSLHPTLSISPSLSDNLHSSLSSCLNWKQVFKQVFSFCFPPEMSLMEGITGGLYSNS